MASTTPDLPAPKPNQPYCDISALEAGFLTLLGKIFVAGAANNDAHIAPSFSFLITHVPSGKRLIFDLGINPDMSGAAFTPATKRTLPLFNPYVPKDVPASLRSGGLDPDDITHIAVSHVHWDHVGDPSQFRNARFLLGGAAAPLFKPGYPADPDSFWHSDLFPADRTEFLDFTEWKPLGPFERAFDFFGDGSFYLVDAPGHLPGHMNALVRTSSEGGWAYLAGDSAHDWRLVRGQADIAVLKEPFRGVTCMHVNAEEARANIRRIASLLTLPKVRVILGHDNEFYEKNRNGRIFWPGKVPSL